MRRWVWVLGVVIVAGSMRGQEAPAPAAPATQTAPADGEGAPVIRRAPRTSLRRSRPNPDAEGKYHIGDGVSPQIGRAHV